MQITVNGKMMEQMFREPMRVNKVSRQALEDRDKQGREWEAAKKNRKCDRKMARREKTMEVYG